MSRHSRPGPVARPRRSRTLASTGLALVGLVALVALSGCGSSDDEPGTPTATGGPVADLVLDFDEPTLSAGGTTTYPDAVGGDVVARLVTSEGGTVEEVEGVDGEGNAIEFPQRCSDDDECPRAMLEIESDPALDPGERDFSFGAAVWLAPDQTTSGSNIVQKGRFATEGGLWKLQVDNEEGQPSCVFRSGDELVRVRSDVSIADSAWHRVECVRDDRGIGIVVDGEEHRTAGQTGSVTNDWPIRIGSPGVGKDDDQFHGRVDDVFLTVALPG